MKNMKSDIKIAVIGLGYVGLPLAIAFSKFYDVIGFDKNGFDVTNEIGNEEISNSRIMFTSNEKDLSNANIYIIAVPTPIDNNNNPYIEDTLKVTTMIAKYLKRGDLVVYESTFYPGLTEEKCIPTLEYVSKMKQEGNFFVGYSPERINPGDKVHRLENITKIVSGIDEESCKYVYELYKNILENEPYKVSSIKIAEACKVLENTQRDINIAFLNEVSKIFKKMNINTNEVIDACSTKWNFLSFRPGLVGGHCIGIDPYYLIYKADTVNADSNMMKISREINESMKGYVVNTIEESISLEEKSVLIYGLTFKENVSDIRNSKIVEIAQMLEERNIKVYATDPFANIDEINKEYGTNLIDAKSCNHKVNAIVIGVAHNEYKNLSEDYLYEQMESEDSIIYDLYNIIQKRKNSKVWTL